MNINWKIRFRNKLWLTTLLAALVSFAFDLAGLLGLTLPVGQDVVMNAVSALLTLLCALGVVIDPTTQGASDSEQAMSYK